MNEFTRWVTRHRDWFIDFVRIFVGFVLIIKGVNFLEEMPKILDSTNPEFQSKFAEGWAFGTLAHFIIFAYILGGIFLVMGFLTRIVIPFQYPVLLLGLFVAPVQQIYLKNSSSTEYFMLIVLLTLVLLWGDGRLSVDYYLEHKRHQRRTGVQ